MAEFEKFEKCKITEQLKNDLLETSEITEKTLNKESESNFNISGIVKNQVDLFGGVLKRILKDRDLNDSEKSISYVKDIKENMENEAFEKKFNCDDINFDYTNYDSFDDDDEDSSSSKCETKNFSQSIQLESNTNLESNFCEFTSNSSATNSSSLKSDATIINLTNPPPFKNLKRQFNFKNEILLSEYVYLKKIPINQNDAEINKKTLPINLTWERIFFVFYNNKTLAVYSSETVKFIFFYYFNIYKSIIKIFLTRISIIHKFIFNSIHLK